MEHQCQQTMTQTGSNRADIGRWTSVSENNSAGGFDCNICLDSVQDPVTTFCGHLYCWPCIYRWIHSQKASSEDPEHQSQCPVCKSEVSKEKLIPIYGRGQGQSGKSSRRKVVQHGLVVPKRPHGPGCDVSTLIATSMTSSSLNADQQHHYQQQNCPPSLALGFAGTTTFHPMIGMFGDMIYGRIFGNSRASLDSYPNTYSYTTTGSSRARRLMQIDKSLSRISFFLFCCIVLCLLLF